MTRDEIIKLAREAGLIFNEDQGTEKAVEIHRSRVERFAAMVADAEREACASICDEQHDRARTSTGASRAYACAVAIRARSQA